MSLLNISIRNNTNFYMILMSAIALIFLLTTPFQASASKSDRGIALRKKLAEASGKTIGTYRALIIGINKYRDEDIPDLKTAVNDARELSELLKKEYGFSDITLLIDQEASATRIEKSLRRLVTQSKEEDSVLIYYAGHGELDDLTGSGWWIPQNARARDPSTYMDNAIIQKYIKAIPARHVFLVADSCFSGTLFGEARSLPKIIDDNWYATLFKKKSRWGMTSGNLTPVADSGSEGHSVFAYQFLESLRENRKAYFTPREIYQDIGPIIRNNSEQMPITKPIRGAGDQGGEFVFIRMVSLSSDQSTSITPSLLPSLSAALEAERLKLEEERRQFEEEKKLISERERVAEERKKLAEERARLKKDQEEGEQQKVASLRPNIGKMLKGIKSSDGRYVAHGDGTVTDTKTGLMWTQKDSYADLGQCFTWNEAKKYVEESFFSSGLTPGGHKDWRMPTVRELKGIYERSKQNNIAYDHDPTTPLHLDSIFADGAAYGYWSSEVVNSCCARGLSFSDGRIYEAPRDHCGYGGVRAVRRGD